MIKTVSILDSSTEVLDLDGTEGTSYIVLNNISDTDITYTLGGDISVVGEGLLIKAGETKEFDISEGQLNKIQAISSVSGKNLVIYANIATPANIDNYNISSDGTTKTITITFDYIANATSYEVSFDGGTNWENFGNNNTLIKTLADGVYSVTIRGAKAKIKGNEVTPVTVDLESPTFFDENKDNYPLLINQGDIGTGTAPFSEAVIIVSSVFVDAFDLTTEVGGTVSSTTSGIYLSTHTMDYTAPMYTDVVVKYVVADENGNTSTLFGNAYNLA